jgi:hypothetical protein
VISVPTSSFASASSGTGQSIVHTISHGAILIAEVPSNPDNILPLFLTLIQMATDHERKFFLASIAGQTERYSDVLTSMDDIITDSAALNAGEWIILLVAYRALIGSHRCAFRTMNGLLEDESINAIPERVAKLSEPKARLTKELDNYSMQLIQPEDSKLLPAADARMKVLCEKLKAVYYRYSVESKADSEPQAGADNAKASSESALQIANSDVTKTNAAYLGFGLTYSVFLYEITTRSRTQSTSPTKASRGRSTSLPRNNTPKQRPSSGSLRTVSRSGARSRQTAKDLSKH